MNGSVMDRSKDTSLDDIEKEGRADFKFSNWADSYHCSPERYFEPNSQDQVKQILHLAAARSRRVKVVGYGHSPSDIACSQDYLVSLHKMNRVLEVIKSKDQVRVEAGLLLCDLNKVLDENYLALSVLSSVSELSVAGAISTGTHGTGENYGILSSYIVDITMMTASGDVLHLDRQKDQDLFLAAGVNLGALGIILTLTVQCEPKFNIEQVMYPSTLQQTLENIDSHVASSDHFRMLWFAHTDNVALFHNRRTSNPIQRKYSWWTESFLAYHCLQFFYWIGSFCSSIVPLINRWYFWAIFSQPWTMVDVSHRIYNFDCLYKQHVNEWAVSREKASLVLWQLNNWLERSGYKAHFSIEVRFVRGDKFFLSPAYGRDSCFINIISYKPYNKELDHSEYWKAFGKIMSEAGGRPHWAKDHGYTGDVLCELFPKWQRFCEIRHQLDPHGRFLNEYLEKIFLL